jgi:hypothetical protein
MRVARRAGSQAAATTPATTNAAERTLSHGSASASGHPRHQRARANDEEHANTKTGGYQPGSLAENQPHISFRGADRHAKADLMASLTHGMKQAHTPEITRSRPVTEKTSKSARLRRRGPNHASTNVRRGPVLELAASRSTARVRRNGTRRAAGSVATLIIQN